MSHAEKHINAAGMFHRTDGPAVVWGDGSKEWFVDGQRHRADGPAIDRVDGTKIWYFNGQVHRDDGPACVWPSEFREWFFHGKRMSEAEHAARVLASTLHCPCLKTTKKDAGAISDNATVVINGVAYTLKKAG